MAKVKNADAVSNKVDEAPKGEKDDIPALARRALKSLEAAEEKDAKNEKKNDTSEKSGPSKLAERSIKKDEDKEEVKAGEPKAEK
jgi:hypothetical protein